MAALPSKDGLASLLAFGKVTPASMWLHVIDVSTAAKIL